MLTCGQQRVLIHNLLFYQVHCGQLAAFKRGYYYRITLVNREMLAHTGHYLARIDPVAPEPHDGSLRHCSVFRDEFKQTCERSMIQPIDRVQP